ncbi:MAG: Na(+)/H(+) antiporter subunit D [Trichloromonadaceae bacterium]
MIAELPPAFLFLAAAVLAPLLPQGLRKWVLLAAPLLALWVVHLLPEGVHFSYNFIGQDLALLKVDRLNRVFGYIFCIISFLAVLFALQNKDRLEQVAAMVYAGSALGVTFAGDFFTLYVFWELMAIASTFVVLAGRKREARQAAFRYVMIHLCGGLFLLAGIILRLHETGSLAVDYVGLTGLPAALMFIGIAVNAAIPPLHSWLKDAYPAASYSGAVFLSAFTTKSAVYVMARTFPGTELLIVLGALMTFVPIFYAVLENDIRSVLSYSLINQVGFMMVGIGIGTPLAINGAVAHAFAHILYKGLLFMSAGAVLYRTGKIRCTDLGGLYKYMPVTCICCIVGAASISAFPLFSGFVTKSMIVSAAGYEHLTLVWLVLMFASAGVFHHAGIKVPFFMFFGHDSGLRPKEAPWNMQLAMGIAAAFCIGVGMFPQPLYSLLPFPVDYAPYTGDHVVGQLQLLMFGALAFALLMLSGIYPAEIRAINLDSDWFYRKGGRLFFTVADRCFNGLNNWADRLFIRRLPSGLAAFFAEPGGNAQKYALRLLAEATGADSDLAAQTEQIDRRSRTGTYPIGIWVLLAVLFLGAMSFLFFAVK